MDSFGSELEFGLNGFQQQKMLNDSDSVAQVLLNLFLARPGNYPSLPHIGINIKQYLYKFEEDIDVDELKEKIYNQSSALIPYLNLGEVRAFVTTYNGQGILLIAVPIQNTSDDTTIVYGFSKDESTGNVLFNYELDQNFTDNI